MDFAPAILAALICSTSASLNTEQIHKLDGLVAQGDPSAARLLAPHVRQLDGGELEDALRAFGQYSTHDMRGFLTLASTGVLTKGEMCDALTALPLDLVDHFEAQLGELRARRGAIRKIHNVQQREYAELAVAVIDEFIAQVDTARLRQPPLTGEHGAAAIAEAAFLEHTHHEITDYSMSAIEHSNTEWHFFIRGEKSFMRLGNDWLITVNKQSGAVQIDDGM